MIAVFLGQTRAFALSLTASEVSWRKKRRLCTGWNEEHCCYKMGRGEGGPVPHSLRVDMFIFVSSTLPCPGRLVHALLACRDRHSRRRHGARLSATLTSITFYAVSVDCLPQRNPKTPTGL
jgi:hypothetical protein